MSEQLILKCEDSITGILTALFDAFVYKNSMQQPYEDSISIEIGEHSNIMLFAREIEIRTDEEKAAKTVYAIQSKLGFSVYQTVFYALCHFDPERATTVLGYLVRAFSKGSQIREYLADPYVIRVMELSRKVGNECQKLLGFTRFWDTGRFLLAEIEPKCDALPVMQEHFADRFPNENFIIFDKKRKYALVHPAYKSCFFVAGIEAEEKEAAFSEAFGEKEALMSKDRYEEMWRAYFSTMAIDERFNEKCQNTLLPKWYRKHMLEFS